MYLLISFLEQEKQSQLEIHKQKELQLKVQILINNMNLIKKFNIYLFYQPMTDKNTTAKYRLDLINIAKII